MKKISRRGFVKGLMASLVVIPFVSQLAKSEPEELTVEYKSILDNTSVKRTIRKGLPKTVWRHIEIGEVRHA